jgi:hypothetical protein
VETQQTSAMPFEEGLTFEKVWAAIQATDRQLKESGQRLEDMVKATDRQIKATDKLVGELSNRFGEIVEYMVLPKLEEKFNMLGFTFSQAGNRVIKDKEHNIFMEIDVFLENGESAMLVELKAKPNVNHVDEHVERMEKMRKYADLHNDKRQFYGAFGGVIMSDNVRIYALKKGFFIIEQSGDTITITKPGTPAERVNTSEGSPPEGAYTPKTW